MNFVVPRVAPTSDNTPFTHRAGAPGRRSGFKEADAATTAYGSS